MKSITGTLLFVICLFLGPYNSIAADFWLTATDITYSPEYNKSSSVTCKARNDSSTSNPYGGAGTFDIVLTIQTPSYSTITQAFDNQSFSANETKSFSKSVTFNEAGTYVFICRTYDISRTTNYSQRNESYNVVIPVNHAPGKANYISPVTGATNVDINADLSWTAVSDADGDTVTHKLYFGTSSNPPYVKSTSNSNSYTNYNPGTMSKGQKYYWRVDTSDGKITTTGTLWSFTTKSNSAPGKANYLSPATGATNVDIDADLSWTAVSDADGDTVTHKLYYGTSSNPPFVKTTSNSNSSTNYDPGTMSKGQKYYWRVDTLDGTTTTTGTLWSFTTEINHAPGKANYLSPATGATGIDVDADLSWTAVSDADGDTVTHKLYFGTSSNPPFVKTTSNSNSSTNYDPGTMSKGQKYYWRVDTLDGTTTTTGTLWSFTTEINHAPGKANYLSPATGATDVDVNADLSWTAVSDADGDTVTHKLYFGTSSNPPFVKDTANSNLNTNFEPGTLNYGTTYYWRVDTTDGSATITGDLWSFTTTVAPTYNAGIISVGFNNTNAKVGKDDAIPSATMFNIADPGYFKLKIEVYKTGESQPQFVQVVQSPVEIGKNQTFSVNSSWVPQDIGNYYTKATVLSIYDMPFAGDTSHPNPDVGTSTSFSPEGDARIKVTDDLYLVSHGGGIVTVDNINPWVVPYVLYLKKFSTFDSYNAGELLSGRVSELKADKAMLSNGRGIFKEMTLGPKAEPNIGFLANNTLPDGYYRLAYSRGRHVENVLEAFQAHIYGYCGSVSNWVEDAVDISEIANVSIADMMAHAARVAFDSASADLLYQSIDKGVILGSALSEMCDNPQEMANFIKSMATTNEQGWFLGDPWIDSLKSNFVQYFPNSAFADKLAEFDASSSLLASSAAWAIKSTDLYKKAKLTYYGAGLLVNTWTDVGDFLWESYRCPPSMGEVSFAVINGKLINISQTETSKVYPVIGYSLDVSGQRTRLQLDASDSHLPPNSLSDEYTWIVRDADTNATLHYATDPSTQVDFSTSKKLDVTLIVDSYAPGKVTGVVVNRVIIPPPRNAFDLEFSVEDTGNPGEKRFKVWTTSNVTVAEMQQVAFEFGDGSRFVSGLNNEVPLTLKDHTFSQNGTFQGSVAFLTTDGRMAQATTEFEVTNVESPKLNQTINFHTCPSTLTAGTSGQLQATATSGEPVSFSSSTPWNCTVSGSTVTSIEEGTCVVVAKQAGNSSYNPAPDVTRNIVITASPEPAEQTITFATYPSGLTPGDSGSLGAVSSSGLTVSFSSKSSSICTVAGSTVTAIATGSCIVAANQPGNSSYKPAPQVTRNIDVTAAPKTSQTITFSTYPSDLTVGETSTLAAAASSGLTVSFSTTTPSVCTISTNTVSAVASGTCTVVADQSGDSTYYHAASVEISFQVTMLIEPGDINGDGTIDLQDAISALKVLSGVRDTGPIYTDADVDGDTRIGSEEVIYVLRKVSGLVPEPVPLFFSDGFESTAANSKPAGWTYQSSWGDSGLIRVVDTPVSAGTKSLRVKGQYGLCQGVYYAGTYEDGDKSVEFDVYVPSANAAGTSPGSLFYSGIRVTARYQTQNSFELFLDGDVNTTIPDLATDTWHHVRLEIDRETNSCTLSENGGGTIGPHSFVNNENGGFASDLSLYGNNNSNGFNTLYFDAISIADAEVTLKPNETIADFTFDTSWNDSIASGDVAIENPDNLNFNPTDSSLDLVNGSNSDPRAELSLRVQTQGADKLTIEATDLYTSADMYTLSGITTYDNAADLTSSNYLALYHDNYHGSSDGAHAVTNREHVFLQNGIHSDSGTSVVDSALLPLSFAAWIKETIVIDFTAKKAEYSRSWLDGSQSDQVSLEDIQFTNSGEILIRFRAWDWAHGSQLRLKNIKLSRQ